MEDVEDEPVDVLMESDIENITEFVNVVEDETSGGDGLQVPQVGMLFKHEEDMYNFYKKYAYAVGFPVKKRNSKKGEDGVLRYLTLTCSREGRLNGNTSSSVKPQPTVKMGCKARISASSDMLGNWRINAVHLEHNHETSPSKSRLYRCNRTLTAHVKRKLEVNDLAGIPLHKSYNSAVVEAGGYENMTCIEKDCRNYVERVRRLRLGEGDAATIQSYFSRMQAQCSGFYFSMDLDDDSRLRNVFWADNRCRLAYKEFGDVVTFDTTYLTNKYDMPFASFVGVNHHGQSTLLGCGLLSNEDTETFVWLFRTWLQCMYGEAPQAIITDQDRAMQNAIEIVFPRTKHRWCLWHILKKLPEKFGYHVDKGLIFGAIHDLVYDSQSEHEFEEGWMAMIDTYSLQQNNWLSGLYENRGRWVPCFLKKTFWAGMSTTQRSESMNAFFDGYVHSKTSLKQFVEQYERALRNKVEKEFQADFKSFSQMIPCATQFEMEEQFQSVYTISKFREVQEEFTGKVYCNIISTSEGSSKTTYNVRETIMYDGRRKRKNCVVSFVRNNCEVVCNCHLFEFRGILCRHAIAVLDWNDITCIPDRYILRRWRRDVRRAHTRVPVNYAGLETTLAQLRYEEMSKGFAQVADLAADDEMRSRAIMEWIKSQCEDMMTTRSSGGSNPIPSRTTEVSNDCAVVSKLASGSIRDPQVARRKGVPRKLRKRNPLETASKKAKSSGTSSTTMRPRNSNTNVVDDAMNFQLPRQYSIPTPTSYLSNDISCTPVHSRLQNGLDGESIRDRAGDFNIDACLNLIKLTFEK
ncbi:protein FAR1-RELATED SEQUENCE 6-like [Olea europaea var. sylvestris]|uniref:protein FAR1-RELATED SEQUENCE 6-like n=1 Tax=Olea europaea var. sylvestris TaxID=158386 RepID=UPI000C1D35EC|nr:protein FAR1-RELATED SEQUENCE 6-like [Olea europaea var. sylvestris]